MANSYLGRRTRKSEGGRKRQEEEERQREREQRRHFRVIIVISLGARGVVCTVVLSRKNERLSEERRGGRGVIEQSG